MVGGERQPLLRLVRMLGMHLLEEDLLAVYIEPYARIPLSSGLVLPAHIALAAARDRAEFFAFQWVVRRSALCRRPGQEVPRVR